MHELLSMYVEGGGDDLNYLRLLGLRERSLLELPCALLRSAPVAGGGRAEAVTVCRSQCSRCPHGHGWRLAGRGSEGAAVAGSIRPADSPEALAPAAPRQGSC